jgi:CheY-like chemotaxis protein/HPt (histidine-containing phosphotransfer) domain-containing protein
LVKRAKKEGIDIFLQKPINPSAFNDILSDMFLGTSKAKSIESYTENKSLKNDIQSLQGSKILLAEDNKTNQDIIIGLLDKSGILIDIANNGKEAVLKFEQNRDYELILMDIQMPEMDGYEATKHIKKIDKDITIIALSANAMKDDIRKSKEAGMTEHLNKPIDVEKLYSTLLKYITKKCDVAKTVDSEDKKIDETEDELPDFSYIDKDKALKMVLNNQKIYVNILKGLYEFKDVKLETMSDEEFKRTIHTIKGISASAGAFKLNEVAIELNKTLDKNLLGSFYHELKLVIDEIEEKIIGSEESAKR